MIFLLVGWLSNACVFIVVLFIVKKSVASLKNNDVIGCFFVNGLYIYQDDKYFLDEGSESMDKNSCTFWAAL